MEFLFNYIKGKNVKDKLSFDLEDINIKKLSDLKIGWCIDLNEQYKYEDGIIDLCENILKKLQSNNLNIKDLKTEISLLLSILLKKDNAVNEKQINETSDNIEPLAKAAS